jgi:hypothetical protein
MFQISEYRQGAFKMTISLQELFATAKNYPQYKNQFDAFAKTAQSELNQNAQLPGVSFAVGAAECSAELGLFGETFPIRVRVLPPQQPGHPPLAAFGVYQRDAQSKEQLLWRAFFDHMGNVRMSPGAQAEMFLVSEKKFVHGMLTGVSDRVFARVAQEFAAAATP